MILVLILAALAIAFGCWLLFTLATLALPVFAAMTVGIWAHSQGSGVVGAAALGLLSGTATLIAGQLVFALARHPIVRLATGLLFAMPAAVAGYHAVHGIAAIGIDGPAWRQTLGFLGAVFIGGAA